MQGMRSGLGLGPTAEQLVQDALDVPARQSALHLSRARVLLGAARADRQRARAGACARVPRRALRAPLDAGGSRGARGRHSERARGEPAAARAAAGLATAGVAVAPRVAASAATAAGGRAGAAGAAVRRGGEPSRVPRQQRQAALAALHGARDGVSGEAEAREVERLDGDGGAGDGADAGAAQDGEAPAGGARGDGARERAQARAGDRERADQRAVEHGRRGRGEPIHDLRDLVVHRSVGRSSFRSMYRGVRFGRRMAFDLRLRRVRLFALAPRIVAGCASRVPRDAGTLAHRTPRLSALVDVRARLAAPRRGFHRGRRGGGRRGGEAHRHIFSREVLASSATRDAAFSEPTGEGLARCRRGRREPQLPARGQRTRLVALHLFCGPLGRGRASRSSPSFPARRFQKLSPRSRGKNLP